MSLIQVLFRLYCAVFLSTVIKDIDALKVRLTKEGPFPEDLMPKRPEPEDPLLVTSEAKIPFLT